MWTPITTSVYNADCGTGAGGFKEGNNCARGKLSKQDYASTKEEKLAWSEKAIRSDGISEQRLYGIYHEFEGIAGEEGNQLGTEGLNELGERLQNALEVWRNISLSTTLKHRAAGHKELSDNYSRMADIALSIPLDTRVGYTRSNSIRSRIERAVDDLQQAAKIHRDAARVIAEK
jgi:hypothetical protein